MTSDGEREWEYSRVVFMSVVRSKGTMIVARFERDQPLNTRRFYSHALLKGAPGEIARISHPLIPRLTYIFNLPVDTSNKNFMKILPVAQHRGPPKPPIFLLERAACKRDF